MMAMPMTADFGCDADDGCQKSKIWNLLSRCFCVSQASDSLFVIARFGGDRYRASVLPVSVCRHHQPTKRALEANRDRRWHRSNTHTDRRFIHYPPSQKPFTSIVSWPSFTKARHIQSNLCSPLYKSLEFLIMHLMYYLDTEGKRVYTLKVRWFQNQLLWWVLKWDIRSLPVVDNYLVNNLSSLFVLFILFVHRKKHQRKKSQKVPIQLDFHPMTNSADNE